MKPRIDSAQCRRMIAARFATVEQVFGNLPHNERLSKLMLRGLSKANEQWTLYGMARTIEKLGDCGYAN